MSNLGSVTVNGKQINLNCASIDELRKILDEVENQEKVLTNELNMILQELS